MGKFTFTQVQAGKNIYLYPDSDICTGGWEYPPYMWGAMLYLKIDEPYNAPDDDETYTYVDTEEPGNFMCGLTDHTSETGMINYVQVVTRARTDGVAQLAGGEFKIVISPTSSCTDYYESRDFNLTDSYSNYSHVWTTNPSTATEWTWDDIDDLSAGLYAYNPAITYTNRSLTIRPTGAGSITALIRYGASANWACVDEEVADENTSYVYKSSEGWSRDTYALTNHTTESGIIQKIEVYVRAKKSSASTGTVGAVLYINGTEYVSSTNNLTNDYTLYSWTWTTNPDTLAAWTWANIDALQAGLGLSTSVRFEQSRGTQCYVIVHYLEPAVIPELRATQLYTIVNYSDVVTCELNKPISISKSHSRNVQMLNFWNGQREVYDLNRSGHSMVLKGIEYIGDTQFDNTPCDRIQCIRDIGKEGSTITISGLTPRIFNGDYKIRSFSWEEISNNPQTITWMLELEKNDL
jgi:hypothetical protein